MRRERGLSLFGALLIVVIAAIAGYYIYQGTLGEGEPPTCDAALKSCMQKCRRTSTEASAAQACQQACTRDADDCKRQNRRPG